jgi:3-methyladenine DNA glycosylase/8-oxoguanine DNA glycosylase
MTGAGRWSERLALRGPGGEPVSLARTLLSHGCAELPPGRITPDGGELVTAVALDGAAVDLRVADAGPAQAVVEAAGSAPPEAVLATVRGMLRLDLDLSGFYERAAGDPALEWAAETGAGRMMRSPTVFEDLVKTLCTTNCTWSATIRMVTALVDHLGPEAPSGRRAFPSAAAMAEAGDDFYKDVARAGYRGPYMRTIADETASGRLDLEALADPERPEEEVAAALTALPGIGPYATAHMMLILGRCSSLVLDSWTRPTYAKLVGRKKVADRTIERRFKRYRENAGLAFWLLLTRDWVEDGMPSPPVPDPSAAQPASP